MQNLKKFTSLLLTLVMVIALTNTVFALEVNVGDPDAGQITISNAAKGETYAIYKLFDATVTGTSGGSIAYQGTIPSALSAYFTQDSQGNISATAAAYTDPSKTTMSEGLRAALATWITTATAKSSAVADGSSLIFKNIDFGYYVVSTTQGESAITVDSTNPSVTVVDKNTTVPKDLNKTVDDTDVNVGDVVTYTVTFKTANYTGTGNSQKKIVSYTIEDTLPAFLTDVTVTSIVVDNDADPATTADQTTLTAQFDSAKKISLTWTDANGNFLYNNGASITITYQAKVTAEAAIDGEGNTNQVTISWTDEDGNTPPDGDKLTKENKIYTYALALQKVDDKGQALAGATFQFPFYVNETPASDGAYVYAGTTVGTGLTNQITTPANGQIVIKGVASGTYTITETAAPKGYNKLTESFDVTAVKTGETTTNTTVYLDANGNETSTETKTKVTVALANLAASVKVVVNKTGVHLPITGGMGTTIFYVLGGLLVLAAAVLLLLKKSLNKKDR